MVRLYLDESGDHTVKPSLASAIDKKYLCLFGCSMDFDYCHSTFVPAFEALKIKHFGGDKDDPVILHLEQMRSYTGPFSVLKNPAKSKAFYDELGALIRGSVLTAFSVVIDKHSTHGKKYGPIASHPYHVGLLTMMERYCGYLKFFRKTGDILGESRGGKEDLLLKAAYRSVQSGGTKYHPKDFFESTLTSKELKLKPKNQNIAALQVADMFAFASKYSVLAAYKKAPDPKGLTKLLADMIEPKFNYRYGTGESRGYGKILIL